MCVWYLCYSGYVLVCMVFFNIFEITVKFNEQEQENVKMKIIIPHGSANLPV